MIGEWVPELRVSQAHDGGIFVASLFLTKLSSIREVAYRLDRHLLAECGQVLPSREWRVELVYLP